MTAPAVLRADARSLPLADDSVDLVVTSPPYFALRSYQDGGEHYDGQVGAEATPSEFVAALLEVTRECMRVLKPSGSLWVNLGDKYAAAGGHTSPGSSPSPLLNPTGRAGQDQRAGQTRHYNGGTKVPAGFRVKSLLGLPWRYALACIDDLGLILRAEVIWSKPNGLPESVTDRVRRSHEQWFHFTLQPRYFAAVDEVREPHTGPSVAHYGSVSGAAAAKAASRRGEDPNARNNYQVTGARDYNPLGKLPGSVRAVPSRPLQVPASLGVDHFAAFPVDWPLWIIRGWSPPAGVVLDPFGGTGTSALAASVLGRRGISVDLSSDYCRLAQWRTTDPGERARALGKPKPEPIPDEQLSLDLPA